MARPLSIDYLEFESIKWLIKQSLKSTDFLILILLF